MSGSGKRQLLVASIAAVGLFGASAAAAAPAVQQTAQVNEIDGTTNVGTATLIRTNSSVTMRMDTTVGGELFELPVGIPLGVDWQVGDATTNWFVVFNEPDGCTDPCGEDDVIAALPPGVGENPAKVGIHYAAGHVAGSSSWHSAGSLREGDTSGMLFGYPLLDARTAEIHIINRSHGPMSTIPPGERGNALNSVDGGCDSNTCGDAQAAIFLPPAS